MLLLLGTGVVLNGNWLSLIVDVAMIEMDRNLRNVGPFLEKGITISLRNNLLLFSWCSLYSIVFIPYRTFLLHFDERRSRAKTPMARPKKPDMTPKRTKKVRLGIYRTQIQPKIR